MKSNIKSYLLALLISSLLYMLISPLRGGVVPISILSPLQLASLVAFFAYFIFTLLVIYKRRKISAISLTMVIFVGASLLQLPYRILNFESTMPTLFDFLIGLMGIISAYIVFRMKKRRILIAIALGLSGIWLSVYGNVMWINKQNYGTITGVLDDNMVIHGMKLQNSVGDTLSLESLNKRFILLDCWFTQCSECYKEMPAMQSFYDKYKNISELDIYMLHCRMENNDENYQSGNDILKRRGYNLPVLSINIDDPILSRMEMKVFPTVLIFERNKLAFRGNIISAKKYLEVVLKDKRMIE